MSLACILWDVWPFPWGMSPSLPHFASPGNMPHRNNYVLLNMHARDMVCISIDSHWQWQYFDISTRSLACILWDVWPFPWGMSQYCPRPQAEGNIHRYSQIQKPVAQLQNMSYKFIILDSDPFYSHTSLCKRADPKMEHFVYPDTLFTWQHMGFGAAKMEISVNF